jgi:hypothetical protein
MKKLILIIIFVIFLPAKAKAASMQDYKYCNHHKFTYFLLKVYDIYLCNNKEPSLSHQNLYSQNFALIINYNINIKRQKFAESSLEEINRYYDLSEKKKKNYYNQLLNIFVNVEPKDQIAAIYNPSGTTTFFYNQKQTGKITNKTFSKIFLNIWLHPKAHYKDMMQDLLGKSRFHNKPHL